MTSDKRLLEALTTINSIFNDKGLELDQKLQHILREIVKCVQAKSGSIMLMKGLKSLEVIASTNVELIGVKQPLDEESPSAWVGPKKKVSSPGFGGLIAFLFFISMLGRLRRPMGIIAGGILAPIAAGLFFNFSPLWILLSIPIGLLIGFILSFLGAPLIFGHGHHHHRRTGGGWSGGFGGGGFSGGGGGFGGGGASGGW